MSIKTATIEAKIIIDVSTRDVVRVRMSTPRKPTVTIEMPSDALEKYGDAEKFTSFMVEVEIDGKKEKGILYLEYKK